jgi:hypothetical protein
MLEKTIAELRTIEQSIEGRQLSDLRVRLALRICLSELRGLAELPQLHPVPLSPSQT